MIRIEDLGFRICPHARRARAFAQPPIPPPKSQLLNPKSSKGFTLVEMIMVITITGIIGGMVAVFLKAPGQPDIDMAPPPPALPPPPCPPSRGRGPCAPRPPGHRGRLGGGGPRGAACDIQVLLHR